MKISHLSFGASSLGSVFRETNEKESFEAVEAAIEGGINFIDVSPYYGHYKAETVLGKALRNIPRKKYFLSTKVGRYGKDGVNTWDYSAKRVTDSVYESMERLGIDFIDLINVHDIEFQAARPGGLQLVVDETLPALVELREKGVVGHVGITDLQLENLKWVVEHSEKGVVYRGLSRFLRAAGHRHRECIAPVDGLALTAWCARLASCSQGIGGGLPEGSCLLQ